ncbi:CvpA family protein [Aestuariivirga sp.]|uniref:CvpA family protein n=1 Tax=Aestuariivirga sp. TaxID=2650926 RepID=UPI0039E5626B
MGFQILDIILIGIMLVSGLLALMRGFTREVLSLVAWGLAAIAAYFAIKQQNLIDMAMPYVDKPVLAQIAVGGIAFLIVLIVVSVISVKISDWVVDSAVGGFDRTVGFIYGLARGFVLVAIAYLFYGWLLPVDRQEPWVRDAKSLPLIKYAGEKLLALMPPDIAETLTNTALSKSPEQTPATDGKSDTEGYSKSEQQGLDNLTNGVTNNGTAQQPAMGQSDGQGDTQ